MRHYECIFRYFVDQKPACCWLRLYQRPTEIVVLLGEVAGNNGAPVAVAVRELATQIVTRFRLNPAHLVWVEYYPPDTISEKWGEYRQVHLTWAQHRTRHSREVTYRTASWQGITRQEVEQLVGSFPHQHPFWREYTPSEHLIQWIARVAGRLGQVWQATEHGAHSWQVLVQGPAPELTRGAGEQFQTRLAAQSWVLHQLAGAAQEFDTLPAWVGGQP